jgi:hypothetical protein
MNRSHFTVAPLSRFSLRFSLFALALSFASLVGRASSLPTIAVVSGSYQATPYASAFTKPFVVKVTNPSTKLGIAGVQVNFTAPANIQLSALSAVTDATGQASVTASGIAADSSSVTAQIAGSSASATFASVNVSKVPLTIVPDSLQSIVGIIPTFSTYSLQGFVNGESAATANITGAPAFATVALATSAAGTYAIKGTAGSLAAPNYSFAQGKGILTLTGVPVCGNLGTDTSSILSGAYSFNLYNQQAGLVGNFTTDGVSQITGQTFFNGSSSIQPAQWSFVGKYRVGNGDRGGAALLETSSVNSTINQVTTLCFAVDTVVGGVATSGRLIEATGYESATAGAFYRVDGTATSVSSFNGAYVLGLQGTVMDTNSGNPLQSAQVAVLHLDGNGNVTGSLHDVDIVTNSGTGPAEQYTTMQAITGSYTFDPSQGSGVITLNDGGVLCNFEFFAPSSQHLLLITQDNALTQSGSGSSSVPVYFGEARKQAAGPFGTSSFSGNLSFVAQGIDNGTAQPALIAELGGILFDGAGTMTHQGKFAVLDGINASTQDATGGAIAYTVDSATGRFESRDPNTNACNLCGYMVGQNDLVALAPGSGVPLFATLKTASTQPAALKLNGLLGLYSVGTVALTSPLAQPFDGILSFDGKGNFQGGADTHSIVYGQLNNLKLAGTYAVVSGAYTLTLTGNTTPDFYFYPNANGGGTILPYSPSQTAWVPLLTVNPVIPAATK